MFELLMFLKAQEGGSLVPRRDANLTLPLAKHTSKMSIKMNFSIFAGAVLEKEEIPEIQAKNSIPIPTTQFSKQLFRFQVIAIMTQKLK